MTRFVAFLCYIVKIAHVKGPIMQTQLKELKNLTDELTGIKLIWVNSCEEIYKKWETPTDLMQKIINKFDGIIADLTATSGDKTIANGLQQMALEHYINTFNPWAVYARNYKANTQVPQFILNNHDAGIIGKHNINYGGKKREIKTTNLLPTPFVGNLKTARFVMLLKNPGLDYPQDSKRINQNPWTQTILDNLQMPTTYNNGFVFLRTDYPQIVCNPQDKGQIWWNRNITNVKNGLNQVSVACGPVHTWVADIELVPYASEIFGGPNDNDNIALITGLSSWFFTRCLIRYVMGRGIPIYTRSGMVDFIPELHQYKTGGAHPYSGRLFTNKNPQCASVSAGNVKQVNGNENPSDSFEKLKSYIKPV